MRAIDKAMIFGMGGALLASCGTMSEPQPGLAPVSQQRAAAAATMHFDENMRPYLTRAKQPPMPRPISRKVSPSVVSVKEEPGTQVPMPVKRAPKVTIKESAPDTAEVAEKSEPEVSASPPEAAKTAGMEASSEREPAIKEEAAESGKKELAAESPAPAGPLKYREDGKILDLEGKTYDVEKFGNTE